MTFDNMDITNPLEDAVTPITQETQEGAIQDDSRTLATPTMVNIGGKEYDPKELESTLSNYSKLQAEYTQKSQEIAEMKRREEEVQRVYQPQQETTQIDSSEMAQYQEAAKLLAPYLKNELGLDATVQGLLDQERQREAMVSKYKQDLSSVEDIAKKANINFSQDELVQYMKEKQIGDVEAAFRAKHFTDLVAHEAKHQQSVQKKPYTETGVKAPIEGTVNKVTDPTEKSFQQSLIEKFKLLSGG